MKVCFTGDIVGAAGKRAFCSIMPRFKADNGIDCLIVNAENSTHGMGISLNVINELTAAGADGFTLGNHAFSNRDFITQAPKVKNCARPSRPERRKHLNGIRTWQGERRLQGSCC